MPNAQIKIQASAGMCRHDYTSYTEYASFYFNRGLVQTPAGGMDHAEEMEEKATVFYEAFSSSIAVWDLWSHLLVSFFLH